MYDHKYKSNTITDVKYHFVWHTKNKIAFLETPLRERAREILIQDCKILRINIIEGRLGKDFVELSVHCPPAHSPSKIMNQLKGRSSKLLQEEFSEAFKEKGLCGSIWEKGYFCATLGGCPKDEIEKYMQGL